ncbi:MAG: serine/threonine-protein kinase [Bacillota bacterium]|nr:serine/threonine-protein kinase [Bacillota bacterium]
MDLKNYTKASEVYRDIVFMENKNTGYQIAVKHAELEKGINEIKAYQSMSHSSLIDFSIDKDGVLMMLHRHAGRPLTDWLASPKMCAKLAENMDSLLASALLALERLHTSGIWHGSINPNKIIIDDDYSVQFVGFGYSTNLLECTGSGQSDKYTAPEIVLGGCVDGRAADLYALGKSLMEILKVAECFDLNAINQIAEMSSVIPQKRQLFLDAFSGK